MNWVYIKHLYEKYERRVTSVAFVFGFVADNLTLTRIDFWLDNLILTVHISIIAATVLLLNAYETGRLRGTFLEKVAEFFPAVMQISFGALFSGFFIFYSRSGSVVGSWPFLLFLACLLVGNEFFRNRYQRFVFQLSIFFVALFSYAVFAVPIAYGRMGDDVFIVSGFFSLAVLGFIVLALWRVAPARFRQGGRPLFLVVGGIYAAFNLLYFTNLLPPIPLSLKDAGVYHSVGRLDGGYAVEFEPEYWFGLLTRESRVFHRSPGESVYVFSSVFAPTRLSTSIFHRWAYYNEGLGEWVVTDQLSFPITGGRDRGYRGFTRKQNVPAGEWRVDVVNERGQMLGRISFTVTEADMPPVIETRAY